MQTIYPRRDPSVLSCTELYILDISLVSEIPCNVVSGACLWEGTFSSNTYNVVDPVTYNWSTNVGVINGLNTLDQVTIWVTSDVREDIEVTLTVTDASGSKTKTVGFLTSVCEGVC